MVLTRQGAREAQPCISGWSPLFLQDIIPGGPDMLLAGKGITEVRTHRCLRHVQAVPMCFHTQHLHQDTLKPFWVMAG